MLALALVSLLVALLLLAGAPPAHAAGLGERLEATEGKLEEVRERKGVLTSTISRYRDRIDALTGEVATIRTREAKAHERLLAKQAELRRARAALAGAKAKLVRARAHLQVALGVLRRHLVAIYESGSPDLLSVVVGADDMEDLAARAEYLARVRGSDEAAVGRVRELRNEVRDIVVARLNSKVTIERGRDYIAGFAARLLANRTELRAARSSWSPPAAGAKRRWRGSRRTKKSSTARSNRSSPKSSPSCAKPAPGRCPPAPGRTVSRWG